MVLTSPTGTDVKETKENENMEEETNTHSHTSLIAWELSIKQVLA